MEYFIDVIVPLNLPNLFTYQVTQQEFNHLDLGYRVMVPFGKSKVYTALVVNKHNTPPMQYQAKEIVMIIDDFPIVTSKQIEHWKFISTYYMCALGEVYATALPSMFLLESESIIQLNIEKEIEHEILSDDEFLIVQALEIHSSLKISDIQKIINKKNVIKFITKLIDNEIVQVVDEVTEKYKPKQLKHIKLTAKYEGRIDGIKTIMDDISRSEKQQHLILHYFQLANKKEPVLAKKLLENSGVSTAILKNLINKGILEEYFIIQDRVIFDDVTQKEINLSSTQLIAFESIKESFEDFTTTLLHGVTASGKTEVYIKLIDEYLEKNQQVLFLLPEIALTTQLVTRLTAYFGNQVSVFHSKYSNSERVEVWQAVLNQKDTAKIIIGTRSSIFLPFANLGLIIIDEEHEQTYKQFDPSPRYHARDAAIVLALYHQAKVLLGSATPSLETYYNTVQKKYGKVELTQRYNNVVLPQIELIDLTEKYKRKQMIGHFSDKMIDEMRNKLSVGEQIIILQNRRGYSPYIECSSCGNVPHCQNCDVSLTYYKFTGNLRCNYCGYTEPHVKRCKQCHTNELAAKGFGTEQLETELLEIFPNIKVSRMDQDSTRGKNAFSKILEEFKNKEVDIMVGTQMLAKGLDFENVTLVCVPNADNMLNIPDFRSHERAFQLLLQVAGRAGRSGKEGKVLIQTYNPYHSIIQQVCTNDYQSMYKEQLYDRLNFKYPPYYRLIKLTLKHKDSEKLKTGSLWLYKALNQQFPNFHILGPEEPAVNRIKNEYIRTILFKISNKEHLIQTKKTIQKVLNSFDTIGEYKSIKISINVDFY